MCDRLGDRYRELNNPYWSGNIPSHDITRRSLNPPLLQFNIKISFLCVSRIATEIAQHEIAHPFVQRLSPRLLHYQHSSAYIYSRPIRELDLLGSANPTAERNCGGLGIYDPRLSDWLLGLNHGRSLGIISTGKWNSPSSSKCLIKEWARNWREINIDNPSCLLTRTKRIG